MTKSTKKKPDKKKKIRSKKELTIALSNELKENQKNLSLLSRIILKPYFWPCLLIIMVISIGIIITNNNKYNPETDVCEEWFCRYNDGFYHSGCDSSCESQRIDGHFQKEACQIYDNINAPMLISSECSSWRSKTKCELNPEAEDCICDKWKNIVLTEEKKIYILDCGDRNGETMSFNIEVKPTWLPAPTSDTSEWKCNLNDSKIITFQNVVDKFCIKAHDPDRSMRT